MTFSIFAPEYGREGAVRWITILFISKRRDVEDSILDWDLFHLSIRKDVDIFCLGLMIAKSLPAMRMHVHCTNQKDTITRTNKKGPF